jgi:hypothetical protein
MQMALEAARSHLLVQQCQEIGEQQAPTKSWWKR